MYRAPCSEYETQTSQILTKIFHKKLYAKVEGNFGPLGVRSLWFRHKPNGRIREVTLRLRIITEEMNRFTTTIIY